MADSTRPSSIGSLLLSNVTFTDTKLGKGADAKVYAVEWNGTVCAAKRLHETLLEDESPGGVDKLIDNFEAECLTWSKLRHPGVVQFLGVHFERSSRLPVLVMEGMDTSLRKYLENHSKEEFPLNLKAFVLRQVTQALAYLHSQNPPLVHHDLSPNNVLLNEVSFVTKVSDFGMSRAVNPSVLSRKSSIKGTLAFMAPEALHDPPRYNEKLDVFSFGAIILFTLTHEWPNPGSPTKYDGDQLVALSELQRREHCTELFTAQEKQLFLPTVCQCLENRPDKRPSGAVLVQELRHIESSLPTGSHVTTPIEQICQQLPPKEEECRQRDEVIRRKDELIQEKEEVIRTLQTENLQLRNQTDRTGEFLQQLAAKEEECRQKDAILWDKETMIRALQAEIQLLSHLPTVMSPEVSHVTFSVQCYSYVICHYSVNKGYSCKSCHSPCSNVCCCISQWSGIGFSCAWRVQSGDVYPEFICGDATMPEVPLQLACMNLISFKFCLRFLYSVKCHICTV